MCETNNADLYIEPFTKFCVIYCLMWRWHFCLRIDISGKFFIYPSVNWITINNRKVTINHYTTHAVQYIISDMLDTYYINADKTLTLTCYIHMLSFYLYRLFHNIKLLIDRLGLCVLETLNQHQNICDFLSVNPSPYY